MSFTLANTVNPNRVFLIRKSELEKRLDPDYYHLERRFEIERLKQSGRVLEPLKSVASFPKIILSANPDNLIYVSLEDIESNTGQYLRKSQQENFGTALRFKKGDVLFPKLRPYLNKVHHAEFDGVCSTEFVILDSKKVSSQFLAVFLRSSIVVNQTKHMMSGNTLPRLQTENIEDIFIPIPNETTQNKVVALMNNAIEQKKNNETAAEKLLSIIDDYLLKELGITLPTSPENVLKNRIFQLSIKTISGDRFDPYHHQTSFTEIIKAIHSGKYPTDVFKHLIIDLKNGVEIRNYVTEGGVRYLRVTDLDKTGLNHSSPRFVSEQEVPDRIKLNNNCILISRSGSLGLVSVVEPEIENSILSSHIFKTELKTEKILPHFLEAYLRSVVGQSEIFRNNNGGVIPEINQVALKSIFISVPPIKKQEEIVKHIFQIRHQAQELKNKTKELLKKASEEIEEILLK